MSPLPASRPKQLSVGPLEAEILEILWEFGCATVKEIHDRLLSKPERQLTTASVTTVLRRLMQKGWLTCDKSQKIFRWQPLLSREEAMILKAHDQLNQFLAISDPDLVAAFADELDKASVEQLEAIAQRLKVVRLKIFHSAKGI